MAGLWSRWRDGDAGEELWSCTIVVKDADDWYKRFHDRMAVVLSPESYDEWLDPTRKRGQLELLAKEAPNHPALPGLEERYQALPLMGAGIAGGSHSARSRGSA